MIRKIIHIDEEKCNGCGACVTACHEGAIGLVNGKAKLMRDDYCGRKTGLPRLPGQRHAPVPPGGKCACCPHRSTAVAAAPVALPDQAGAGERPLF